MNKPDSLLLYTDQLLEINPQNDLALQQAIYHYWNTDNFAKILTFQDKVRAIKITRRSERTYRKQGMLNLLSMSNYKMGNYKEALVLIQEAIAIDPDIAIMYTTLAETYELMGKKDKFYESLEIALAKGYNLDDLLEEPPYKNYTHQPRFKALAKKYKKKEKANPQLVKN